MKSILSTLGCVLVLGVCPCLGSQTKELRIGEEPPPLEFQTLLQAPTGARASWEVLKGKVVVLEFWATWCIPCIRAMPHLNEMADALKDTQVQFIAISDEKPDVVASFLKKQSIRAWIGLDSDKSTFSRYGVKAIPYAVVVDPNGKVAAVTSPGSLTEKLLRDLAAGKPMPLPAPERQGSFSFRPGELSELGDKDHPALFRLVIRPSESLNSGWGGSGGKFTFIGSSVMNLLCAAHGIDETRVIPNCELPNGRFDAVVNVPTNQADSGRTWLRSAVEGTFGLVARMETRQLDVLVLTVTDRNAAHLTATLSTGGSSSHSDASAGQMQSMNVPISSIVGSLQGLLKKPVIDETGLTNRYDWQLQWNAKGAADYSTDALLRAVRDQLGLELTPAKRPVEVVVVNKAG